MNHFYGFLVGVFFLFGSAEAWANCNGAVSGEGSGRPKIQRIIDGLSRSVFAEVFERSRGKPRNEVLTGLINRSYEVESFSDLDLYFLIHNMPRHRGWGTELTSKKPKAADPTPAPVVAKSRGVVEYERFRSDMEARLGIRFDLPEWTPTELLLLYRVVSKISQIHHPGVFMDALAPMLNILETLVQWDSRHSLYQDSVRALFRRLYAEKVSQYTTDGKSIVVALQTAKRPIIVDPAHVSPQILDAVRVANTSEGRLKAMRAAVQSAATVSDSELYVILAALPRGINWGLRLEKAKEDLGAFDQMVAARTGTSWTREFLYLDVYILTLALEKLTVIHSPDDFREIQNEVLDVFASSHEWSTSNKREYKVSLLTYVQAVVFHKSASCGGYLISSMETVADTVAIMDANAEAARSRAVSLSSSSSSSSSISSPSAGSGGDWALGMASGMVLGNLF